MKRHLALVGFMAAGKSTIGRKLARRLQCAFYDTDALVVREHGEIAEIFAREGEEAFRRYERAAVAGALDGEPGVVAVGGGALTQPENRDRLARGAHLVFLRLSPERIFARVRRGSERRPLLGARPSLAGIAALYAQRMAQYASADYVVEAERLSDGAVIEEIVAWLHERKIAFPR